MTPTGLPGQDLAGYRTPAGWHPGAPLWRRGLWLLVGQPLLASWVPGTGWRKALLRAFGARLGRGGRIKPRVRVTFPWRLVIGDDCWLGEGAWLDNLAPISIGDRVCLSQAVYLCTGNHDFRRPCFDLRVDPIHIGDDVWIGAMAVLAPGTTVGPAAVVTLGSVASATVPAGMVVRGNPAVVVASRARPGEGEA